MKAPIVGKRPLGPIHSLIRDRKGRVYLSDELNHRVLCLTEEGEVVWWHGADSADPIPFHYPRGLALGRDRLAVCDSWNNRVVFLSLESGQIGEWKTAGDLPFREVSDIRFIEDHWIVLDRGNQRLCWLGLDGQLLNQVGEPSGSSMEPNSKYPVFELMAEKYAPAIPKAFPPYNLLNHPDRIIGESDQMLAVSESLGSSLKLIRHGFLYPLPLDRTCDSWLALDERGLVGWDKVDRVLLFLDLTGKECLRIPTNGVAVSADLHDREWWEQDGQTLSRHAFEYPFTGDAQPVIDLGETEAALGDYLGSLETLDSLQLKEEHLKRTLEMLSSSVLKWRLCGGSSPQLPQSFVQRAENSLNAAFVGLVARLDRLVLQGADSAVLWPIGKFLSDCFNVLHASSRGWKTDALKEVDRWQIDGGPRQLALSPKGTVNVSFWKSSSILEIDTQGRSLGQSTVPAVPGSDGIGPNGMAWDENGRLWLTYGPSKCVVIWDVSRNSVQTVNGFNVPFAICKGGSGHMLITDREDNSLIDISYKGDCKRLPGQFINPNCLVAVSQSVWVVDHRNHRLQKLNVSGDFMSELGGCGLEKGKMALPLTAAAFSDGTLAVSMWHLIRCLMMFSPGGEELGGIAIDFVPEGMLVVEDKLLVVDSAGNQIRVYRR